MLKSMRRTAYSMFLVLLFSGFHNVDSPNMKVNKETFDLVLIRDCIDSSNSFVKLCGYASFKMTSCPDSGPFYCSYDSIVFLSDRKIYDLNSNNPIDSAIESFMRKNPQLFLVYHNSELKRRFQCSDLYTRSVKRKLNDRFFVFRMKFAAEYRGVKSFAVPNYWLSGERNTLVKLCDARYYKIVSIDSIVAPSDSVINSIIASTPGLSRE